MFNSSVAIHGLFRHSAGKPFRLLLASLLAFLSVTAHAQLTSVEHKAIDDVLTAGNLRPKDLEFDRTTISSPWVLSLCQEANAKPLEAIDDLLSTHDIAREASLPELLTKASSFLGPAQAAPLDTANYRGQLPADVPEAIRPTIEEIVHFIAASNEAVRGALKNLAPDERRMLIEGLSALPLKGTKESLGFVKGHPETTTRLLELLSKVDLPAIRNASITLATEVRRRLPALQAFGRKTDWKGSVVATVDGVNLEISGVGNDAHELSDRMLCIDFGGVNHFAGRYAAGIGYSSVLIDFGSSETIDTADAGAGCGVLGIGMAFFIGGNAHFHTGSLNCGAGVGGVGVLVKSGGAATYRSATMSQGYGAFGVGMLIDTSGENHYTAQDLSQGAGFTGGLGWLIDRKGDSSFHCVPNDPTKPARAQGYGGGTLSENPQLPGGIGLLTACEGSHPTTASSKAQGFGEHMGLGSFFSGAGGDTLTATSMAQGVGLQGGSGYLLHLVGSNTYTVRQGSCQGFGVDKGVGVLLDRQGDTIYASAYGRPGSGVAGGLGILIDPEGDDRYWGSPGVSTFDALGIFVHVGGSNRFADTLHDNQISLSNYSVAASLEDPRRGSAPAFPDRKYPKPGSEPTPSETQLQVLYERAMLQDPLSSSAAVDGLVAIGTPAVEWILKNKLGATDSYALDVISEIITAVGQPAKQALAPYVQSDSALVGKNAIELAIRSNAKEVGAFLSGPMSKPETQLAAVQAAGELQAESTVQKLMPLAGSQDKRLAEEAMKSLARIGSSEAVSTATALLLSDDLIVRRSAMELVAKFPSSALAWANPSFKTFDERLIRISLELLGKCQDSEAVSKAASFLDDSRPAVRIQALLAINGRVPKDSRGRVLDLRNDPDPLVRQVAAGIDLGR
ncbi:MAG: HEAT repeat domain-containing protein [Armatimonadetes bacterium]|nr:HEAT repeat domain-containing protein [Armatimonadota bacterium]